MSTGSSPDLGNCEICGEPLAYSGRGPKPKSYCSKLCRAAAKRRRDSARPNGGHKERDTPPPCCRDARETTGVSNATCEQHKEQRKQLDELARRKPWLSKPRKRTPDIYDPADNPGDWEAEFDSDDWEDGYELGSDPYAHGVLTERAAWQTGLWVKNGQSLNWYPDDPHEDYTPNGIRYGYDTSLERQARKIQADASDDGALTARGVVARMVERFYLANGDPLFTGLHVLQGILSQTQ